MNQPSQNVAEIHRASVWARIHAIIDDEKLSDDDARRVCNDLGNHYRRLINGRADHGDP